MRKDNRLHLIGIGYRPLGKRAREIVMNTGSILASSRLLDVFKRYDEYGPVKERVRVIDSVPETISYIRERFQDPSHGPVVLLASGDPFFFGIGRRIVKEFGKDAVEILPDLSSMQEAFSRINEPWDDAFCISVHGGPETSKRRVLPYDITDIPHLLVRYPKIAVLTDRQNNPAIIAGSIKSAFADHVNVVVHVCERIGYPEERVWKGPVGEAADMTFADPNVMIILRKASETDNGDVRFGSAEEEFSHRDGMITKDEVRAVSLHKLRLPSKGIMWDIGAGSGSVAIESARLSPGLKVLAVERDEQQITNIRANKMKFDARNLEIVHGPAPDTLADLGNPDRVFIGGSGGALSAIVELAGERMQTGIVVINAATLETLQEGIAALEKAGFTVDISEVSASRSKIIAGKKLMSAMNPVFIIRGVKG